MPFPHPKSRNEQHGNEDILKHISVRLSLGLRTIDESYERQAEEDVDGTEDRSLG